MRNIFKGLVLAVIVATTAAHAEITDLKCEQTGAEEYHITFRMTGETHRVRVLGSSDAAVKTGLIPMGETAKPEITVHAGKPGERMYFLLQPDHGAAREVSIRHLALEGTPNFRDEGGYETADHRFTRWGVLYRSGVLSGLTPHDLKYLSQLGIRAVCDFRTEEETSIAPEKWTGEQTVKLVSVPVGTTGADHKSVNMKSFLAGNPTPEQAKQRMEKVYGVMVLDNADSYAATFRELIDGPLPMLYHCTAGKDRTGVFSAMVLRLLGVPESTILADYRLTDKYMDADGRRKMAEAAKNPQLAGISQGTMKAMMAADPAALGAAFHAIDEKYGSFDNYRKSELKVSDADVAKLKERLLMQ